jgi:hypothetical protein
MLLRFARKFIYSVESEKVLSPSIGVIHKMTNQLQTVSRCIAIFIVLFLLSGCKENAVVTCKLGSQLSADFGPTQFGSTTIGILNTHRFVPGYFIELFPPQVGSSAPGTGSVVGVLKTLETDIHSDNPPSDTENVVTSEFDVSGDAKVKAVEVQIKTALSKSTQIKIGSGQRKSFSEPLALLDRAENSSFKQRILDHPDRLYVLVTGAVYASSISLQYKDETDVNAKVNVVKITGEFSVDISYKCSELESMKAVTGSASPAVAFFYSTLHNSSGKVDTTITADLTKYALPNAIQ